MHKMVKHITPSQHVTAEQLSIPRACGRRHELTTGLLLEELALDEQ